MGEAGAHGPARFGSYGSPPSGGFREINCRAFESRAGLFQTQSKSVKKPVNERASSGFSSPQKRSPLTPLPVNTVKSYSGDQKKSRKPGRSNTFTIPFNLEVDVGSRNENSLSDEFPFSELWAGPAYSNSPPPSSLPMPSFPSGLRGLPLLNLLFQHLILIFVPLPSLHQHPQPGSAALLQELYLIVLTLRHRLFVACSTLKLQINECMVGVLSSS